MIWMLYFDFAKIGSKGLWRKYFEDKKKNQPPQVPTWHNSSEGHFTRNELSLSSVWKSWSLVLRGCVFLLALIGVRYTHGEETI